MLCVAGPRQESCEAVPGEEDDSYINLYHLEVISFQAPKKVPQELIDNFLNGAKNPVSAIMEYAAITKIELSFQEAPLENFSYVNKFANICTVEGTTYPQGTGKTKKEAKTNAAKIAFTALLGLEEESVEKDQGKD